MTRLALNSLGRLLASLPVAAVRGIACAAGFLIYFALRHRRRASLRALHGAFPQMTERQRRAILRESCARLVEMGLFLVASPFFSERRLRATLTIAPDQLEFLRDHIGTESHHPTVFLVPHFTLSEALTLLPLLLPFDMGPTAVVFRPVAQPALDSWVRETRERFGAKLISRRTGFSEVSRTLEENGNAAILFDQSAGGKGALITMFGWLASATELPGLLASRHRARTLIFYPERTGFWQARLKFAEVQATTPTEIALEAHRWLENHLASSADRCADWLWLHDRWGIEDKPGNRFHLRLKRNRLAVSNRFHGYESTPRRTRLWIGVPEDSDSRRELAPLLKAIREHRPDMAVTLVTPEGARSELESSGLVERLITPPPSGLRRLRYFWKLRREYPDVFLVLTEHRAGDLEAWLTRAPQRFGIRRPGRPRPFLTAPPKNAAPIPPGQDRATEWETLLHQHGLPRTRQD